MPRLLIGQTALNQSLYKIGKRETGNCDKCGYSETVNHIFLECTAYNRERLNLVQSKDISNYSPKETVGERNKIYNT